MIKTFFYKLFEISSLKNLEIQFYLSKMYFNGLDFNIELFGDKTYFQFYLDLYLFKLDLTWSRRRDHAGINLYLTLFNVNLESNIYDIRHWDEELEKHIL